MDFLDVLNGRYDKTHTGRYFERLPEAISYPTSITELYGLAVGEDVDYEFIDPTEWRYKTLLGNLKEARSATTTIKTRDVKEYKNNAYILLDTGRLCEIISVIEDVSSATSEAARLFPIPIGTEYVLRLVEVENPWGL